MTSEYESHPAFCEDSDGLCMIKHERDRYKAALEEILNSDMTTIGLHMIAAEALYCRISGIDTTPE